MKFSIDRSEFTLGVNTVCKAISSRTTLPILENLYLAIQNNQIVMRGNDLELGIEYVLPVNIEDQQAPSGVLLKANTLNDILSKLNSDTVDIDLNELLKCNIKSSAIDFDIHGVSIDEYPQFPTIEKNIQFDIDSSILLDLIKHTIFSVSYDETKQFLNGIKIRSLFLVFGIWLLCLLPLAISEMMIKRY